jgi:NACHT domain
VTPKEWRRTGDVVGRFMKSAQAAGSSGGRANEAGSLHRSGAAAFLAAHGLRGRGLELADFPGDGAIPISVVFETSDAVDDLRCTFTNGTSLMLQAKRACGADGHLGNTVEQWVRQVRHLEPGDLIGLVTAEPKGKVKRLGAALARMRREHPGAYTTSEREALDAVRNLMPEGTSDETCTAILNAAVVLKVAASSDQDIEFKLAAELLDGRVVLEGSGAAAVKALQRAFQEQASEGRGSGLDEWLQILADAGLEVFADADGPAGPRRRAELDALSSYRRGLAARFGLIELSALAEDLPPVRYVQLLGALHVSVEGPDGRNQWLHLIDVARRWPRMLLTGLPGIGKSTAVAQLAAYWAAHPQAPVPVVVSLLDIAKRQPRRASDTTSDLLLEIAASGAAEAERKPLFGALSQAAGRGEAVFLLDGLDECRDLRSVVADGLAEVARSLPGDTGMLLTTRDSALAAADKLGLPHARLIEPASVNMVSRLVLRQSAERRVPAEERSEWIEQRQTWLDTVSDRHYDMWSIPLLAMLLTLIAAAGDPYHAPGSRAELLARVVDDSVARWEVRRPRPDSKRPGELEPEMLTDGFATIGRLVAQSGACASHEVQLAVTSMLNSRWGLAPAKAAARAREILAFWDDDVGVFVRTPGASQIVARSRVFSEVGEARWLMMQSPHVQRQWMASALPDDNRRDAILLAAGLSNEVAEILAEAALSARVTDQGQALLLAADATHNDAALQPQTLAMIMTAISAAAAELVGDESISTWEDSYSDFPDWPAGRKQDIRGRGWPHVRRLAMLRLPSAELRAHRRSLLMGFHLTDQREIAAAALAALADAVAESRGLLREDEAEPVRRLLAIAVRRSRSWSPEYSAVALQAISYLPQLGRNAGRRIHRILDRERTGAALRAIERLKALGYDDPNLTAAESARWEGLRAADPDEYLDVLLRVISEVSPSEPPTLAQRWRMPELAALFDVLSPSEAEKTSINVACAEDRQYLADWIRVVAKAVGLDAAALAAQAGAALASRADNDNAPVTAALQPAPLGVRRSDTTRLDNADIKALIDALQARSEWIADIAAALLVDTHDVSTARNAASLNAVDPAGQTRKHAVMIANDEHPPKAALRALDGDNPAPRVGAAIAARVVSFKDPADRAWTPVIARLLADHDHTVRRAYHPDASAEGATTWSCPNCSHCTNLDRTTCAHCKASRDSWNSFLAVCQRILNAYQQLS